MVAIGFSGSKASLERLPGWESESWAYHSDDGKSFFGESTGKTYGPTFGVNDVIGCGINFITGSAFFTKNGISLGKTRSCHAFYPPNNDKGIAFRDLKNVRAFPSVGVKRHASATIKANFGQSPFVFDIDGLVEVSYIANDLMAVCSLFHHSERTNQHRKRNRHYQDLDTELVSR